MLYLLFTDKKKQKKNESTIRQLEILFIGYFLRGNFVFYGSNPTRVRIKRIFSQMGKYYLRTGPATTRVWRSQPTARLFTKALSVNSIGTIMGCHGIACTYYHDAPVYGLLAPSEETHDRSPVKPSTALAEPTTTRNGNHPDLSHRIVPCSPIRRSCRSPAGIRLRAQGERAKSTAHPSLEGGSISPSLLRTFTAPHPHLSIPASQFPPRMLSQVYSDRAGEVPAGAPFPIGQSVAASATQELLTIALTRFHCEEVTDN